MISSIDDDCSFCLNPLYNDIINLGICNHYLHIECLLKLITYSQQNKKQLYCPICNTHLFLFEDANINKIVLQAQNQQIPQQTNQQIIQQHQQTIQQNQQIIQQNQQIIEQNQQRIQQTHSHSSTNESFNTLTNTLTNTSISSSTRSRPIKKKYCACCNIL